jgi:hypothetical protein
MGSSHSYVSDPSVCATEVKGKDNDRNSWKAYDYVIVGGGTPLMGLFMRRATQ